MSGYNGRRAPNFSQYINDLNAVPSPFDQALQQEELFDINAELELFTNAEFPDFDSKDNMANQMPLTLPEDSTSPQSISSQDVKYLDMLNADFNVPGYQYYPAPILPAQSAYSAPIQQPVTHPNAASAVPVSPLPNQSQPALHQSPPRPQPASTVAGAKRKQDISSLDDSARLAQEEDKRRRNTAASARFRIKKKEREKTLERTVKDVTSKNATLEARISQLELENRWLKNLITEKNGSLLTDGDISGMFSKFQESKEGLAASQRQKDAAHKVKAEVAEVESIDQ